jgi:hypothetical protein
MFPVMFVIACFFDYDFLILRSSRNTRREAAPIILHFNTEFGQPESRSIFGTGDIEYNGGNPVSAAGA